MIDDIANINAWTRTPDTNQAESFCGPPPAPQGRTSRCGPRSLAGRHPPSAADAMGDRAAGPGSGIESAVGRSADCRRASWSPPQDTSRRSRARQPLISVPARWTNFVAEQPTPPTPASHNRRAPRRSGAGTRDEPLRAPSRGEWPAGLVRLRSRYSSCTGRVGRGTRSIHRR
jgi:hypothetical protein